LYNHLARAYSLFGDHKKVEEVVIEEYRKFPNYLFARINYAQICLFSREFEKIPEIFDNKFDLKLLYPDRSVFHVSEVMNFNSVMGTYFALNGNMTTTKVYYRVLKQLAPEDEMTRHLEHLLEPSLFLDRIKAAVVKETR